MINSHRVVTTARNSSHQPEMSEEQWPWREDFPLNIYMCVKNMDTNKRKHNKNNHVFGLLQHWQTMNQPKQLESAFHPCDYKISLELHCTLLRKLRHSSLPGYFLMQSDIKRSYDRYNVWLEQTTRLSLKEKAKFGGIKHETGMLIFCLINCILSHRLKYLKAWSITSNFLFFFFF